MINYNLSWTTVVDRDWIIVNPTAGTGSQDVSISVIPSDTYMDSDTAGTVTFICTDCNPPLKKVITVTRCYPTSCGDGVTTYEYGDARGTAEQCDTSATVTVPYTATTVYSVPGCPNDVMTGTETYTCSFPQNDGTSSVTHTFYYPTNKPDGYGTITIVQNGGAIPCYCNCDSLSVNGNITLACEAQSNVIIGYVSINECFNSSGIHLTLEAIGGSSTDWLSNVHLDGGTVYGNVTKNDTEYNRSCSIKVSYSLNGQSCQPKTFTISQVACVDICKGKEIKCISDKCDLDCNGGTIQYKFE